MALKITIEKVDNGATISQDKLLTPTTTTDPSSKLPAQIIIPEAGLVDLKKYLILHSLGFYATEFVGSPQGLTQGVDDVWDNAGFS